MTSRQAIKGGIFERSVFAYLSDQLGACVVRPRVTTDDVGDIHVHPLLVLEVKNYTDLARAVRTALSELPRERAAAGLPHGAVVVKRHGKADPARQLVVMELDAAVALWREAM